MVSATERMKFVELRAKTDRDLLTLIYRGLDRAFRRLADGFETEAARAYRQADVLLSKVHKCPAAEWLRLEARLAELGRRLGHSSASDAAVVPSPLYGVATKALGA